MTFHNAKTALIGLILFWVAILGHSSDIRAADISPWTNFYVSENEGKDFEKRGEEYPIVKFVVSKVRDGFLCAITYNGEIIQTEDFGKSWEIKAKINKKFNEDNSGLFLTNNGRLFVYNNNGFWILDDQNSAMVKVKSPFNKVTYVREIDNNKLIVGGLDEEEMFNVFVMDNQNKWEPIVENGRAGFFESSVDTLFIKKDKFYYRFVDNSFEQVDVGVKEINNITFMNVPSGAIYMPAALNKGYLSLDDGYSWQPVLRPGEINALVGTDKKAMLYVYGMEGKLIKKKNFRPTWDSLDYFDINCSVSTDSSGKKQTTCWPNSHHFMSRRVFSLQKNFGVDLSRLYGSVLEDYSNDKIIIAYGGKIYLSYDDGNSWSESQRLSSPIVQIWIDKKAGGYVYALSISWPDV